MVLAGNIQGAKTNLGLSAEGERRLRLEII